MARLQEYNKEEVLKAATEVYWAKGYHGTSMQDLVEATGLNRSSIYNSFDSKLNLYLQTLKFYQKESGSLFQKALLKANNPLEAVQFIFEIFLPIITDERLNKGCYVMSCKTELGKQEGEIQDWLLNNQENSINIFRDLVLEGQKLGIINTKQSADSYAYYLFSAFQGFRMTGILINDKLVLKEIIKNTIEVIR